MQFFSQLVSQPLCSMMSQRLASQLLVLETIAQSIQAMPNNENFVVIAQLQYQHSMQA